MLSRPLALHNPNCRGTCAPDDCVQDLEAFCGSIRAAHFGVGVKRSDGSIDGQLSLSSADAEDVLAYLVSRGWELAQRFDPVDDGRGSNRLAGFLTQRLHFACTDWTRKRWGSTRYPTGLIVTSVTPTSDVEQHIAGAWLDDEYDDSDALDFDMAPAGTREALALIQPLIDGEVRTMAQAAERAHAKLGRVTRASVLVRAAARQQGLGPDDVERRELADQAAELREQGLTYPQIGAELGCSHSVARGLIGDYHPALVKVRAKRPRDKGAAYPIVDPHPCSVPR